MYREGMRVPTTDLDRAVTYLEMNYERSDFLRSVYRQWQLKHRLTERQIETVLRIKRGL